MKERNVESYDQLPNEYQVQHDLLLALTLLHAPPELQSISKVRVETLHARPPQQQVLPKDLHQTFRYGIPIDKDTDVIARLQEISQWLREKLP